MINGVVILISLMIVVSGIRADLHDEVKHYKASLPDPQRLGAIVILTVGIILESFGLRPAKFVNVGYFVILALESVVAVVLEMSGAVRSGGMTLIFMGVVGIPSAVVALTYWRLYKRPENGDAGS